MNLWLRQFGFELLRLFARKRTYIGFGAFLAVEGGLLLLFRLEVVKRQFQRVIEQGGYVFEDYYSGLTLGLMLILWTVFLLGALYLALVGGDMVSKEVEEGTLRMTLCRPVSRGRVFSLKVATVMVYTGVLCLFIGLTALAMGMLERGPGGLFVFSPMEDLFAMHDYPAGIKRYFLAMPFLAYGLLPVSVVALFLSCLKMKPAAATVFTLSYFFADSVLRNIPFLADIRPWFVSTHMGVWVHIFQPRIPWGMILEKNLWLTGFMATLLMAAWIVLERRDFKT